jgi:hypothetical protein
VIVQSGGRGSGKTYNLLKQFLMDGDAIFVVKDERERERIINHYLKNRAFTDDCGLNFRRLRERDEWADKEAERIIVLRDPSDLRGVPDARLYIDNLDFVLFNLLKHPVRLASYTPSP